MQKNKLGELLSYYCSAQSLNRWAVIAGSWVFWNREAQRSCSSLSSAWSPIVKLRNICPGTSSNGWRDHRRKQKMEQGKKFLTFLRHCSVCDYRTEQPKAQKLLVALSPQQDWGTARSRGGQLREQWRQKIRANWTEMFAPSWILNPQPPHIFHQSTEST